MLSNKYNSDIDIDLPAPIIGTVGGSGSNCTGLGWRAGPRGGDEKRTEECLLCGEQHLHTSASPTSEAMPEYVKPEMLKENWKRYVDAANKHNKPGEFTVLIAYEWTSIPNGRNVHRNVFFRNDTGPKAPLT